MSQYYAIITDIGNAKIANAIALGKTISLTHMAIGDANGRSVLPTPTQKTLIHETYRAQINSLTIDNDNQNVVIAEFIIPEDVGGFYVRELGVFDNQGNLIAVGNTPESYKPKMTEGSGAQKVMRMHLVTSASDKIELKINPSIVVATIDLVNKLLDTKSPITHNHDTIYSKIGHTHNNYLALAGGEMTGKITLGIKAPKIPIQYVQDTETASYHVYSKLSGALRAVLGIISDGLDIPFVIGRYDENGKSAARAYFHTDGTVNIANEKAGASLVISNDGILKFKGVELSNSVQITNLQNQLNTKASTSHTHLDLVPTTRKVNSKVLSADVSLTASDVGAAPASHTHTIANITDLQNQLNTKASTSHTHLDLVPTTRKVNSKVLSADVSLTASDVGAAPASHTHTIANITDLQNQLNKKASTSHTHLDLVPTTRKVNGKVLSEDVSLTALDVGAASASHTHNYLDLSGGEMTGKINLGIKAPKIPIQYVQEAETASYHVYSKLSGALRAVLGIISDGLDVPFVIGRYDENGKSAARAYFHTDGTVNIANEKAGASLVISHDGLLKFKNQEVAYLNQFASSKAINGWQKLPSGLIIQWGINPAGNMTTKFPIAFPNACLNVTPGEVTEATNNFYFAQISTSDKTGFESQVYGGGVGGTVGKGSYPFSWFAIGY